MHSQFNTKSKYPKDGKRSNKFFHEMIELNPSNLLQEVILKVGCSVPYGFNISNVCIDEKQSNKAMELYNKLNKHSTTANSTSYKIQSCPYPCKFTRTYFKDKRKWKRDNKNPSSLFLRFNKFVKVSKARYSYGGLELLAELGGYVGLFLGISVFHLSDAFAKIVQLNTL